MADDAALLALLALLVAVEAAGAKAVLIGDHHQLGAVGPGGGLAALVARHHPAVVELRENVRQREPAERAALEAEWGRSTRQRWILDTDAVAGPDATAHPRLSARPDATVRVARLRAERDAVAAVAPDAGLGSVSSMRSCGSNGLAASSAPSLWSCVTRVIDYKPLSAHSQQADSPPPRPNEGGYRVVRQRAGGLVSYVTRGNGSRSCPSRGAAPDSDCENARPPAFARGCMWTPAAHCQPTPETPERSTSGQNVKQSGIY